jgi:hypothetical protein
MPGISPSSSLRSVRITESRCPQEGLWVLAYGNQGHPFQGHSEGILGAEKSSCGGAKFVEERLY